MTVEVMGLIDEQSDWTLVVGFLNSCESSRLEAAKYGF